MHFDADRTQPQKVINYYFFLGPMLKCFLSGPNKVTTVLGGGGVQQQKRQRTSCDFPGGMIFFVLFCSLFEDILLTKSGENDKKEQKRTLKIKKYENHDLFCSFLRTHF